MRERGVPAADPRPVAFRDAAAWRAWLRRHHRTAGAVVLRIAKRHAAATGVTYDEALDEALCFGWIDGITRALDADGFRLRFTPRRPRSVWSPRNVERAGRLIREGRMAKAGLAAFEARIEESGSRRAGRPAAFPRALEARLRASRAAWTHWSGEAPWYRRTVTNWVLSAKREDTRLRRLDVLVASSERGERIPPLERLRPAAARGKR